MSQTPKVEAGHTPGRLAVARRDVDGLLMLLPDGIDQLAVAIVPGYGDGPHDANAKRIALCWNCHDDLVKACKAVSRQANIEGCEPDDEIDVCLSVTEIKAIRAALTKAGCL